MKEIIKAENSWISDANPNNTNKKVQIQITQIQITQIKILGHLNIA